ncbi:MAG: FAD-dependent monooxygenase [Burkholderiaceae bacterium]|nr:FAD-dependent monooxygenase [Burkholderiaceae bacterium]
MNAPVVCVRGSGAVALSAALALARRGCTVRLQARMPAASADVRTYALGAASVALLQTLKVWDALPADARTRVLDMRIAGDQPGHTLHFSAWSGALDALAWIVDAAELESALRSAVRFAPHVDLIDPDINAPRADLLVLAEGRDSALRERLGVRMPRQPYGQRGVAARLVADAPHGGLARQWFRSPDVLALLPFDRPQPGSSYGLVWSVPDARADELLALDAAAFEAALMDATGGAAGALKLAGERAAWPLLLAQAEPVCGPGWVLLGDAAHLVHPLAGQGLNLGFADVQALDAVLAERQAHEPWRPLGDLRLLQRYARRRAGPTAAMGRVTDGLLHLFASDQPVLRELRNRGLTLVDHLPPLKRWLVAAAR